MADYVDRLAADLGSPPSIERAQALAAETGALVYWKDAEASKALIAKDIATMGAIGAMLE